MNTWKEAEQSRASNRGQKTQRLISLLKFIVLQKSNYYLTRKKDKGQIIYITNSRPTNMVLPLFTLCLNC